MKRDELKIKLKNNFICSSNKLRVASIHELRYIFSKFKRCETLFRKTTYVIFPGYVVALLVIPELLRLAPILVVHFYSFFFITDPVSLLSPPHVSPQLPPNIFHAVLPFQYRSSSSPSTLHFERIRSIRQLFSYQLYMTSITFPGETLPMHSIYWCHQLKQSSTTPTHGSVTLIVRSLTATHVNA